METIRIKHREFNILESLSEDSFLLERKEKKYFARKFTPKAQEGYELTYSVRKLSTSGVKTPKLYWIDDKNGYVVSEYVEAQLASDYLSENDLTEKHYENLFRTAYFARLSNLTLDYEPDKWMIKEDELIYLSPMTIRYQKEKDLVDHYIRLWFNTNELASFLSKLGKNYDKSRIKNDFSTNKEIVLMTCKYYR